MPVYVLRENAVLAGALGGIVLSHHEQGRQAALIAEKVLQGTPISSIKVIRESPNRPIFNYFALKRFGISEADLPPDSLVLNKPVTIIEQYAALVASMLAVFALLIGFITYLVWQILARKRVEKALRENEERFRNLIEGSIQGVLIDRWRKPVFVNRSFADILGYESPDEILAMDSMESCVAPHERERLQRYTEARLNGEAAPALYEYDAVRKDGSIVSLQNFVRVIRWNGQPAIESCCSTPITRRSPARTRSCKGPGPCSTNTG